MALAKNAMTGGGAELYVSAGAPATWDAAGFAALTWTQIGNLVSLDQVGQTWNTTNYEPLSNPEIEAIPTNYSMGAPAVTYALPKESTYDSGQTIVDAAVLSTNYLSIKIVLQNGYTRYFQARVTSNPVMIGGVSDINMVTANMQIYTAGRGFVDVAAP